ncbi:hypothetical protein, partial [Sinorhizobium medicae]|uniref:hypothetical protein n=1 Tax=Sinorhizobium medicae TaxID=110321 RepID=UPI0027DE091E
HDSKHGTSAISNHPVPLLSMTELISRSQSAKARWAVRSAHPETRKEFGCLLVRTLITKTRQVVGLLIVAGPLS